jgi:preprotein translocase subunit SecE
VAVKPIINYLREVRSEMRKVIWPKKEEVIRLTMVVFFISVIVGIYLGGLDYIFTKVLSAVITK